MQSRYEILDHIGSGATSRVYLAREKLNSSEENKLVALKEIKINKKTNISSIYREAQTLKRLRHPNIVYCFVYYKFQSSFFISLEYCESGSLADEIQQKQKDEKVYKEIEIVEYASQISKALNYIHDLNVLHRDLKPSNVMINKERTIKLCDFGVCKILSQKDEQATTFVGTPSYCAPEVLDQREYGTEADIWGLGCVLLELATLKRPFGECLGLLAICNRITKGIFEPVPKRYSIQLAGSISSCLRVDPLGRIKAKEFLKSKLFDSIDEIYDEDFEIESVSSESQSFESGSNQTDSEYEDDFHSDSENVD